MVGSWTDRGSDVLRFSVPVLKRVFIDWPAYVVDHAWFSYQLLLIAAGLVCLVTAVLWWLASVLGYRLP